MDWLIDVFRTNQVIPIFLTYAVGSISLIISGMIVALLV